MPKHYLTRLHFVTKSVYTRSLIVYRNDKTAARNTLTQRQTTEPRAARFGEGRETGDDVPNSSSNRITSFHFQMKTPLPPRLIPPTSKPQILKRANKIPKQGRAISQAGTTRFPSRDKVSHMEGAKSVRCDQAPRPLWSRLATAVVPATAHNGDATLLSRRKRTYHLFRLALRSHF